MFLAGSRSRGGNVCLPTRTNALGLVLQLLALKVRRERDV